MSTSTVEIKGKEYVSKAARDAAAALKLLGEESKGVFSGVTVTAGDVVNAVKAVAATVAEFITEYAEQERAILTFNAAMKTSTQLTSSSAASLREYAEAIALKTGADDEAVLSMEALLATSGRTEAEIKKIISAAADMSVVTGKDLRTSVEELNKTFSGSEGRLNTLIPALKDLTEEELKSGAAIDIVAKQYGGLADELGGSMSVRIENFKNSLDDLKAAIAGAFAPVASPFLTFVENIITKWTQAIEQMNRYRELSKKGEKITAAEQLEWTLIQMKIATDDKKLDEKANIGDFNSWFKTQIAAGMFKLTGSQLGDEKVTEKARGQYDEIARAFRDTPTQKALTEKIAMLIERSEALRGQLKSLEKETVEPSVAGSATASASGGSATGSTGAVYDIQSAMITAIRGGTFNIVSAMESFMSLQPEMLQGISEAGVEEAAANTELFDGFIKDLQNVNYNLAKDIETAMKEGVTELGYQQQDPGMGVGGIGRGGQADYRNSDPAKGGPGNISDLISGYSGTGGGIGDILSSIAAGAGPLMDMFGGMIGSLGSLNQVLNPMQTIFASMLEVLAPLIDSILAPIVGVLKIVGVVLAAVLKPSLEFLAVQIEWAAKAFLMLYNLAIVPVANVFIWFATQLNNLFVDMYNGLRSFMKDLGINIGKKKDKQDASDDYLETITYKELTATGTSVTGGTSGGTSGGAASYSAPRDITVNVVINTDALVGEGGIRDFSLMIGRELRSAGVLGMA